MTVSIAVPVPPTTNVSPMMTGPASGQAIFDAMEVQQIATVDGGRFANPSSLASELANSLRGFMERAERISQRISHGAGRAEAATVHVVDGANVTFTSLHAGPARQSLDPAETGTGGVRSSEASKEFEFLQQVSDELFEDSLYRLEAGLIARGAGHISTSVNTLLKGQ
jgi:hypothetical protein